LARLRLEEWECALSCSDRRSRPRSRSPSLVHRRPPISSIRVAAVWAGAGGGASMMNALKEDVYVNMMVMIYWIINVPTFVEVLVD
jgi:hypothetical protein